MTLTSEDFLTAYHNRRLVAGALKAAHVRMDYANYEDLLQEGLEIYAQALAANRDLPRKQLDRRVFRKIIWHTLDVLRREQFIKDKCGGDYAACPTLNYDSDLILSVKTEVKKMSVLEQQLFYEHVLAGKTLKSLAASWGLSQSTLSRKNRKLLEKLRQAL